MKLKQYLKAIGLTSTFFGFVFFVSTISIAYGAVRTTLDYGWREITVSQQVFFVLDAMKDFGLVTFNAVTLGGICFYLSFRLSENKND